MTIDRAHRPGQFKRWFLRSLQEEFDARLHPFGWDTAGFAPDARWMAAMLLDCPADKPAGVQRLPGRRPARAASIRPQSALRMRQIPLLRETRSAGPAAGRRRAASSGSATRPTGSSSACRTASASEREPLAVPKGDGRLATCRRRPIRGEGLFATFEFREQIVGWPHFTIDAPEGTIVELMCQEAHDPAGPAWLDSQFFNWSRFICREGVNRFEAFDFESLRWLQLHVRNAARAGGDPRGGRAAADVRLAATGPQIRCSEPALQRLFDASLNTLYNSAQETCVDGMARERQQYSGDGGHQLLAVRSAFGEPRLRAALPADLQRGP